MHQHQVFKFDQEMFQDVLLTIQKDRMRTEDLLVEDWVSVTSIIVIQEKANTPHVHIRG